MFDCGGDAKDAAAMPGSSREMVGWDALNKAPLAQEEWRALGLPSRRQ
jgi:hypothetical protein